jgi:hypothetical protein
MKYTVLNPRGQRPVKERIPMAPRLDTLDGKTIYIIDVRWPYTENFVRELQNVLLEKYPKTKFVFRDKLGSYFDNDPNLWMEIKQKGNAAIVAVGH